MGTIKEQLEKIKSENRLGLMTHAVLGYPGIRESEDIIRTLASSGSDFIELQIPFSDPVADGPTLMRANQEAIRKGARVAGAFEVMSKISREVGIPLLFMTYFNIVFRYGVKKFCEAAKKSGCAGLIVPDAPIEEEEKEGFIKAAGEEGLPVIRVFSPASTEKRYKVNAPYAEGFTYFASRKGTTGARAGLPEDLERHLKNLRSVIDLPVAVGFGISSPEQVRFLKGRAEIAVVGSALLNAYENAGNNTDAVAKLTASLRAACED